MSEYLTYLDTPTTAGTNISYVFPFDALTEDSIVVTLDGQPLVRGVGFNVDLTNRSVVLLGSMTAGKTLRIKRVTPADLLVSFTEGAGLKANDLNKLGKQLLYLGQENVDVGGNTLIKNANNIYDAGNIKIQNTGQPTLPQDVTTKSYVDSTVNTVLTYGPIGSIKSWSFTGSGTTTFFELAGAVDLLLDTSAYLVFIGTTTNIKLLYPNEFVINRVVNPPYAGGNTVYNIQIVPAPAQASRIAVYFMGYARAIAFAAEATKLATPRTVAISGDITGTATAFDGTANISIPATLPTSGVTPGSYQNASITVDNKGRVTAASTGTAVVNQFNTTTAGTVPATGTATGYQARLLSGSGQWVVVGGSKLYTFTTSNAIQTFVPSSDAPNARRFKVTVIGGGGCTLFTVYGNTYRTAVGGYGGRYAMYFEPANLNNPYNIVVGREGYLGNTQYPGETSSFKRAGEIEIVCTGGATSYHPYTIDGTATLSINNSTAVNVSAYVPPLVKKFSYVSTPDLWPMPAERFTEINNPHYGQGNSQQWVGSLSSVNSGFVLSTPAQPGAVLIEW